MRILIVEDNRKLAGLLAEALTRRGFSCDVAHSLADAELAMSLGTFDALVLDQGLPDGDGRAWLADHARTGLPMPVLILSARSSLNDRVAGLDSGADDYVVKPVDVEELSARLRALLRRPNARESVVLTSGRLTFDPAQRLAAVDGNPLELSRREASLLELLLRRVGRVVGREALDQALYSFDDAVSPNALEAVVSRLRRKLETAGEHDRLHTVRGVGYLLAAPRD